MLYRAGVLWEAGPGRGQQGDGGGCEERDAAAEAARELRYAVHLSRTRQPLVVEQHQVRRESPSLLQLTKRGPSENGLST